jgi:hypothetical protein
MLNNKLSLIFILSVIAIVSADILQLFAGTSTTTRKPTIGVSCFTSYKTLSTNFTEFGKFYENLIN